MIHSLQWVFVIYGGSPCEPLMVLHQDLVVEGIIGIVWGLKYKRITNHTAIATARKQAFKIFWEQSVLAHLQPEALGRCKQEDR